MATTSVKVSASTLKKKEDKCLFCEKTSHELAACPDFKHEESTARWKWARENKLCYSCLKQGHQVYKCFKRKTCEKEGCQRKHHSLLHFDADVSKDSEQKKIEKSEVVIATRQAALENTVLLRIAPVILHGPLGDISTYALFDEASTVTLIDAAVSEKLGLVGQQENLNLRWTNTEMTQVCDSSRVSLQISTIDDKNTFQLTNVRTINNLDLPVQTIDTRKLSDKWNYLKKVDVSSMKNAKPRILIGQDNCDLIVAREVIEGPRNAPTLTRTKLGWIVHGNVKTFRSRVDEDFLLHVYHNNEKDDLLHQLVKDFFSTDTFGVMAQQQKPQSKDDERAQRLLEATTQRVGDRWETGLLWKQDNVNLLNYNSKAVALHRLKSIEQKMDKDAQFSEKYCAKIEEYLTKNYARIVPEDEKKRGSEKTWYLPHFGVVNPNKPGKFRFVFDAAAKTNGKSINDFFLQGPDLLNSLPGVLFRFRQREIAFSADIKEMFHQVRIRREDSMAQRFLWRGQDRNREPDVLEMSVMIFGSVSSPFQAQEIKNKNAREFEKEYPNAARAIIYRHYMDDYLDSAHTEEESKRLIAEVIEIHRSAGFEICNWISSSKEVLRSIPKHLRSATKQDLNLETNDLSIERVLGLHWNANDDTFIFICKFHKVEEIVVNGSRAPTKREDIWRSEIHWDDELQSSCLDKWKKQVSKNH